MLLPNPLIVVAMLFVFLFLGLIFLFLAVGVFKKKKLFGAALSFLTGLLLLSLSASFGAISLAVQGYHALTREELAAIVKVEPTGEQRFIARFSMPDGSEKTFSLAGDQLYVDAHILKWKPFANMLGLHTSYELDRVSGRYANLNDETTKVRTVYSLAKDKPVDMFQLRQRFAFLNPLLDAEYGSATFNNATTAEEFRVMVSTTGLLIRTVEKETGR